MLRKVARVAKELRCLLVRVQRFFIQLVDIMVEISQIQQILSSSKLYPPEKVDAESTDDIKINRLSMIVSFVHIDLKYS